ncbi:MAG: cation:dicarboxylase symporter family transporter [Bryobacterales bacterium]|nr:cation:dicarboxylase symporter family transporter [Bryobacterales bacterium]
MALGLSLGLSAPDWAGRIKFVNDPFLRLIRSITAPVLVGVLIRAIAGAGSVGALGRLGWKAAVCFEIARTIAMATKPGEGLAVGTADAAGIDGPAGLAETLESAVPTSIVDALARGDVLQIVVICFLFGIACLSVGSKARPVVDFADALAKVAFRYTDYVMYLAPPAVLGASAKMVAGAGFGAPEGLAEFAAVAWLAQGLFLGVLLTGGLFLCGVPVRRMRLPSRQAWPRKTAGLLQLGMDST